MIAQSSRPAAAATAAATPRSSYAAPSGASGAPPQFQGANIRCGKPIDAVSHPAVKDGVLSFYMLDATEERALSGTAFLFGKVAVADNVYESCCVEVQDIHRVGYVCPRAFVVDRTRVPPAAIVGSCPARSLTLRSSLSLSRRRRQFDHATRHGADGDAGAERSPLEHGYRQDHDEARQAQLLLRARGRASRRVRLHQDQVLGSLYVLLHRSLGTA